ncbi:hypothetical protein QE152_g307 [Popillia japonica]|uniref:Uncharacterized protein n=1 Tax=Popillia japonica TaxID=7064 RepID=A0AAW1NKC8_POPJA
MTELPVISKPERPSCCFKSIIDENNIASRFGGLAAIRAEVRRRACTEEVLVKAGKQGWWRGAALVGIGEHFEGATSRGAGLKSRQPPSPQGIKPCQPPSPQGIKPCQPPSPQGIKPCQPPSPQGIKPCQPPSPEGIIPCQPPSPQGIKACQPPSPQAHQGPKPCQPPPHQGPKLCQPPPHQGPKPCQSLSPRGPKPCQPLPSQGTKSCPLLLPPFRAPNRGGERRGSSRDWGAFRRCACRRGWKPETVALLAYGQLDGIDSNSLAHMGKPRKMMAFSRRRKPYLREITVLDRFPTPNSDRYPKPI